MLLNIIESEMNVNVGGNHIKEKKKKSSLPLNWNIPDQLQREPEAADRLVRPGVHQLSQIYKD